MARVALQQMRSPLEGLAKVMAMRESQTRRRQLAEAEKEKEALRQAVASGDWNRVRQYNPALANTMEDRIREEANRRAWGEQVQTMIPQNEVTTLTAPPPPGVAGGPMLTQKEIQPSPLRHLAAQDPYGVLKYLAAQSEAPKPYPTSQYLVGEGGQPVPSPVYEPEGYGPIEARQGYIGQMNRKTGKFEKIGEVKDPKQGELWTPPYELRKGSGVLVQRNTETGKIVKITAEKLETGPTMTEINARIKQILSRYASPTELGGWEEDPYANLKGKLELNDPQAQKDYEELNRLFKKAKEITGTGEPTPKSGTGYDWRDYQ